MPTASLFNAIKTQLLNLSSDGSTVQFVQLWNNQLQSLKAADTEANIMYSFSLPALFVEFLNLDTMQLGNGIQLYSSLTIRIHILHRQEDAGDGTMEQNLAVLDLRDAVQVALQNFKTTGASEFIRKEQKMDYNHNNMYHYIMDYECTYVDVLTDQPVNGITTDETITPEIESSYDPHPYIKTI